MWYIFFNGTLFSHKRKEILTFATTWMDSEGITLSKVSQTEKDKYCMILLICETQKNKNKKQTHRKKGSYLWLSEARGEGGGTG